ncbi:sigma-70 family RNA polymerase sigma factor [Petroclostridium sp. X23]|uniref:RNA polymerase sigma factor n=1 Tax=Petroclostridium sp. X23 TaxID=3045146 RepID=UPI0024AE3CB8|nr:sigma-70 family RNA polymerase sigma factor [Petroclostridium sp. X23]WHH59152.1 sigma-70 family RNA polymerase sigma factor [Petroclostridium sp. X23]
MKKFADVAIRELLPFKQRQVLKMYYIENKNIQQIAEELDIDKSTVSRRLNAAKKFLKKIRKIYSEVAK